MKPIFTRLLSGALSASVLLSNLPNISASAEESNAPYPYTLFAASDSETAISSTASNFSVNGNVTTNGLITTGGNLNINGTKAENAEEDMIYIFDKIDSKYFEGSNIDEYSESYSISETNIDVCMPTEVYGEATLKGNINISSAIKALEDVNLLGDVQNSNDSVIFSKYGNIIIDSQNVNLNGLVYAPFGNVTITANNLNMNSVVIIADSITLNTPNVNANYNSSIASFIGNESELLNIPEDEWHYLKDDDNNGIPDILDLADEQTTDSQDIINYRLFTDKDSLLAGSDDFTVYFYLETLATPSSIELYEGETKICDFYDDGQYSLHGDDMMGDGVYSLKYTLDSNVDKDEIKTFKAFVDDKFVADVSIKVYAAPDQEEIDNMKFVNDFIKDKINSMRSDDSSYMRNYNTNGIITEQLKTVFNQKVEELCNSLQGLLESGNITSYKYHEDCCCITYTFANGITMYILSNDILPEDQEFNYSNYIIPDTHTNKYEGHNMVIFNCFESSRDGVYEELVRRYRNNGLNVDYFDSVNDNTIRYNIANHDIVLFSGHGDMLPINDSGEETPVLSIKDYPINYEHMLTKTKDDIDYQRILPSVYGYYCITSEYINYYFNGVLDGSFMVSESCYFYGSYCDEEAGLEPCTVLADSFISKRRSRNCCWLQ